MKTANPHGPPEKSGKDTIQYFDLIEAPRHQETGASKDDNF